MSMASSDQVSGVSFVFLPSFFNHFVSGDEVIEWNGRLLQSKSYQEVADIIAESKQEVNVELIVSRPMGSRRIAQASWRQFAAQRGTGGHFPFYTFQVQLHFPPVSHAHALNTLSCSTLDRLVCRVIWMGATTIGIAVFRCRTSIYVLCDDYLYKVSPN